MAAGILEWGADNIQASIFLPSAHTHTPSSLFRVAFEAEPTNTQENSHPQFGRLGSASLNTGDRVMAVGLQPGRCDITVNTAHNPADTAYDPSGKIIDVVDTLEFVSQAAERIADTLGDVARLALHCRLVMGVKSRADSNAALLRVMPYKIVLGAEEDFILQLNFRTAVGEYGINRLVKWSSESIVMVFEPAFMGYQQPSIQKEALASVVHLDFNTLQSITRYTPSQARAIFKILTAEIIKARKTELRFKS